MVKSQIFDIADNRSFSDNENLCSTFRWYMAVSQADMDIYLTKMLQVKVQECTDLPILLCKILFIGIKKLLLLMEKTLVIKSLKKNL